MLINPDDLKENHQRLEEIEKASLRLVVQAIFDFKEEAVGIFKEESDLVADIGEDITREALDRMGMSKIDQRLYGKMDYKKSRYLFHPEYAIKQALFVDSKAEKVSGQGTATLQTSQLSMRIKQIRAGEPVDIEGKLPFILKIKGEQYLTTTIFVKYNYREATNKNKLKSITIAALPNGILQAKYNPDPGNTIWLAGRNAPTLGEEFRVRLKFDKLKEKSKWRVQSIDLENNQFDWDQ